MTQKELDILFEITAMVSQSDTLAKRPLEEVQEWVRNQLAMFQIYSRPSGASWGVKCDENAYRNFIETK